MLSRKNTCLSPARYPTPIACIPFGYDHVRRFAAIMYTLDERDNGQVLMTNGSKPALV